MLRNISTTTLACDVIDKYKDAIAADFDGISIELPFSVAAKIRDIADKNQDFKVRKLHYFKPMKENNCDIYEIIKNKR